MGKKNLKFKYTITLSCDEEKTNKKKMTMSEDIRCRLFVDESRIRNMNMANNRKLLYMCGY